MHLDQIRARGTLRMIWSSFCEPDGAYGIGIAESKSGKIKGPWTLLPKPIIRKDGGHGMIFDDFKRRTHLVFHTPSGGDLERTKIIDFNDWKPVANYE